MTEAPSPFCAEKPTLQYAWDATSLSALMFCPRYYQQRIIEGWEPRLESVHLTFGGLFAGSCEAYKNARVMGASREDATLSALTHALERSGTRDDDGTWRPWGGHYEDQWHCRGTTPYRNDRGNRAKCPYSKAHVWLPGRGPDTCGRCGSPCETVNHWVADDNTKDRYSLVRLVVWYCLAQGETSGPQPYAFPDGTPAVELSFRMPFPRHTPYAEAYLLCGHIDSIMTFGEENFLADNKTTKKPLGVYYFSRFSPNVQFDTYDLAGATLMPYLRLSGVMVEAAQITPDGANFGFHLTRRTDAQREEYLRDLQYWLSQAEAFAAQDFWPMNRANCTFCDFRSVCSKPPASRARWLAQDFKKRHWNPLEER